MLINSIVKTNFCGLTPISKYKGVILKLTNEEKTKIAELMNQKSLLLIELTSVEKKLDKHKTITGSLGLYNIYGKISYRIQEIDEMIREIKINRKKQQIEEMENINLVV